MQVNVIPPPTPEDLRTNIEQLYASMTLIVGQNHTPWTDLIAKLCRLLAAERAQNAERGEIIKEFIGDYESFMQIDDNITSHLCGWCGHEYDEDNHEVHFEDCLVERARRAGVEV